MQPRNTVVTFQRHVIVENTEGMTDEQIESAAVDLYNDPPGGDDDMYVNEGNIVAMQHERGTTPKSGDTK